MSTRCLHTCEYSLCISQNLQLYQVYSPLLSIREHKALYIFHQFHEYLAHCQQDVGRGGGTISVQQSLVSQCFCKQKVPP